MWSEFWIDGNFSPLLRQGQSDSYSHLVCNLIISCTPEQGASVKHPDSSSRKLCPYSFNFNVHRTLTLWLQFLKDLLHTRVQLDSSNHFTSNLRASSIPRLACRSATESASFAEAFPQDLRLQASRLRLLIFGLKFGVFRVYIYMLLV